MTFDDLSKTIDWAMLFGASITPAFQGRGCSLRIARSQKSFPALIWAVTNIERTSPELLTFSFLTSNASNISITCTTKYHQIFRPYRNRWYCDGSRKIPKNITLDDDAMVWWILGAINPASSNAIRLNKQDFTADQLKEILTALADFNAQVEGDSIILRDTKAVTGWLSQHVPAAIWTR